MYGDLAGKEFGFWIVVERIPARPGKKWPTYLCRCKCGAEKVRATHEIIRGVNSSCGKCDARVKYAETTREQVRMGRINTWGLPVRRGPRGCANPSPVYAGGHDDGGEVSVASADRGAAQLPPQDDRPGV
jgi:hypothetical protein